MAKTFEYLITIHYPRTFIDEEEWMNDKGKQGQEFIIERDNKYYFKREV